MQPIIIIGSGLAGYTVAREFRKLSSEIPLTLICADNGDFYSKPMLSNAMQSGKTPAQLVTTAAAVITQQLKITLMANTFVEKIDVPGHRVYTNQGSISYSKLVLAVGAQPLRIPMEGDGAQDVMMVNHLDDYARFYQTLSAPRQVAIIGGGLIGCEFANDLITGGHKVTVIHPHHFPMNTMLPEAAGNALALALQNIGVQWQFGVTAQAVHKTAQGYRVTLSSGKEITADVVLSAVGLRPNTQIAQQSGIITRRGILVDQFLRTNAEDVYALGDCAEYGERVLPYVLPIMTAARALVKTLTDVPTAVVFPHMPVVVKTPACPVVVQLPDKDAQGQWLVEEEGGGIKMSFVDPQGQLAGFVLVGERTKERSQLLAKMAPK